MRTKQYLLILPMAACLLWGLSGKALAQQDRANRPYTERQWSYVADRMPVEWYASDEAKAVAEQVLLYQRESGGWPKNQQMHQPMTDEIREKLKSGNTYEATLDNNATTTEMKFMARVYEAFRDPRYRESFERGLSYLLEAQYDNGGWPQFYPLKSGYYTHITFNDNAIVNIMNLLKEIFDENPLYGFVATPETVAKARTSFDKGLNCILKTQIYVDGKPTVWCAQHDEVTLEPTSARAYELPSYSGGESAGIVLLLMDLPNPSPEIINAVEGAVKWFEDHKIEGLRFQTRLPDGSYDRHVVEDPEAPLIWARFYDLETEKPIFVGRDGIKMATLAEIEYERRNGYGYYTFEPQKVLDAYPKWKARVSEK